MDIITVSNLTKYYGKHLVLDHVSFKINQTEIIAIVGPNGSGKSTLLNTITNLIKPTGGTVTIFGKAHTNPDVFKEIAFMQDHSVLYDYLTGYDHLQFIADVQSLSKERIIETAKLIGNDSYLHKKVKHYSLGMKQHLLLAMAIINKPKLLILDEPLNGLDPTSAIMVRELLLHLHQQGTTILLSSHNLGEIDRITTKILFLKNGKLISEDLTQFVEYVYELDVSSMTKAVEALKRASFNVTVQDNKLRFISKEHTLTELLSLLQEYDIQVLDIEKHVTGSEERYKQIFRNAEDTDATI